MRKWLKITSRVSGNERGAVALMVVLLSSVAMVTLLSAIYVYVVNRAKYHSRIKQAYVIQNVIEEAAKMIRQSYDRGTANYGGKACTDYNSQTYTNAIEVKGADGRTYCFQLSYNDLTKQNTYVLDIERSERGTLPAAFTSLERWVAANEQFFDDTRYRTPIESGNTMESFDPMKLFKKPTLVGWLIQAAAVEKAQASGYYSGLEDLKFVGDHMGETCILKATTEQNIQTGNDESRCFGDNGVGVAGPGLLLTYVNNGIWDEVDNRLEYNDVLKVQATYGVCVQNDPVYYYRFRAMQIGQNQSVRQWPIFLDCMEVQPYRLKCHLGDPYCYCPAPNSSETEAQCRPFPEAPGVNLQPTFDYIFNRWCADGVRDPVWTDARDCMQRSAYSCNAMSRYYPGISTPYVAMDWNKSMNDCKNYIGSSTVVTPPSTTTPYAPLACTPPSEITSGSQSSATYCASHASADYCKKNCQSCKNYTDYCPKFEVRLSPTVNLNQAVKVVTPEDRL
jgi:hypothetical protein